MHSPRDDKNFQSIDAQMHDAIYLFKYMGANLFTCMGASLVIHVHGYTCLFMYMGTYLFLYIGIN